MAALATFLLFVALASGVPEPATRQSWHILSAFGNDEGMCDRGGIQIILLEPGGADLSVWSVNFNEPSTVPLEETWHIGNLLPGEYHLEAITLNCMGAPIALHRIAIEVGPRELQRTILIGATSESGSFQLHNFQSGTDLDGAGLFELTDEQKPEIRYLGPMPLKPCRSSMANVSIDWLVAGEWTRDERNWRWGNPEKVIAQGDFLPLDSSPSMVKYVRWGPGWEKVAPEEKRLTIDIAPFGEPGVQPTRPWGYAATLSCDRYLVSLPLTDNEPTFNRRIEKPSAPDTEER